MDELSNKEKELNKKLGEVFLYEIGQEYSDIILDKTDELHEKYKDLDIPDSIDKWFDEFNQGQRVQMQRDKRKRSMSSFAKRVAIFLLLFVAIGGSLTIGVEAFRLRFFNILFVDNETHTDLSVLETENEGSIIKKPEGWSNYFYPEYLPFGFDLENYSGIEGYRVLHFGDGKSILSMYERSGETDFFSDVDTEGVEPDFFSINGSDAIYVSKNGNSTMAWLKNDTLIKLYGPISKEEIIKVAENIKKID